MVKMLFLWLLSIILSTTYTISGEEMDERCFDNCSCCIDEKCGPGVYGWTNMCTVGCIDGHSGARCYVWCQYPNCKSCGGNILLTECTACYDGYYLGPNKDCISQCPSNCKSCTSSTMCTECKDGFYDKDGSTSCSYAHCPANCECNNQWDCVSCKNGFYDTSTLCTKQCPINCRTCESEESCSECKHGFYNGYKYDNAINLQLDNCTYSCRDNCTQCQSYNKCLQCKDGKYGTKCELNCPVHCAGNDCEKDSGTCFGCDENFQGAMCDECKPGYYGPNCDTPCSPYCSNSSCNRNNGTCVDGCKTGYSGDKCCVMSENCAECDTNTKCKTCVPGYFETSCNATCLEGCNGACHISTGKCIPIKEAQQHKDAPNTVPFATAAVLGSMFTLSFTVNIVILVLFLLKKIKISPRQNSQTVREPTYENQLKNVGEQFPRTTHDATDTIRSGDVERNVYEGIRSVDEKEHEYQQVSYNHGNRL